jgi:hypothetical protein
MNHIHISINGKTVLDETQNDFSNVTVEQSDEFEQDFQTSDDTFYYEGMWGEIIPMKKNSWGYWIFKLVCGSLLVCTFLCLLPYLLIFFVVIFAIIAKLLGF